VFRHVILELLPVPQLAQHFSPDLGAPTKELYSMAGLVFLSDFLGWTAEQAAEAYLFRTDVQYALNLDPGVEVAPRTVERYQRLFREDETAAQVFHDVTIGLAERLELDVTWQRLDSTHVFSHMETFGRTKLIAVDACPAGHRPVLVTQDEESGATKVEMPAGACSECPAGPEASSACCNATRRDRATP